jgi:hypothetical protein
VNRDPELFFPAGESGLAFDAQVAAAKAVCARCPVRQECLAEAIARISFGIAGGLTAEERRGLGRRPAQPIEVEVQDGGAVVEVVPASRAQLAAVGRRLLAAGIPVRVVATRCRVTERTVTRWAATTRADATAPTTASGGAA